MLTQKEIGLGLVFESSMNREEALRLLGLSKEAGPEAWKSAYRSICKKYHPDSLYGLALSEQDRQAYETYFMMASKAYSFLENSTEDINIVYENSSYNAEFNINVGRKPRVFGAPVSYKDDDWIRQEKRARERLEKESLEKKKKRLEELKEEGKRLKSNEEEILEKIRWIRIANIIHEAIEADKKKSSDTSKD